MNHALWKATGARVLAMTFIIAGVAACDRGNDRNVGQPGAASPSAVVIGTTPSTPTTANDTAQTTPPPSAQSDVSAQSENSKRPLEGDDSSHSTVAPVTPQKAEGVNTTGKN